MFQYYFELSRRERLKGPLVLNESADGWRMTCRRGKRRIQMMTAYGGGCVWGGAEIKTPYTGYFLLSHISPQPSCFWVWTCNFAQECGHLSTNTSTARRMFQQTRKRVLWLHQTLLPNWLYILKWGFEEVCRCAIRFRAAVLKLFCTSLMLIKCECVSVYAFRM